MPQKIGTLDDRPPRRAQGHPGLFEDHSAFPPMWFSNAVRRQIIRGNQTRFWLDTWIGNTTLHDLFPRLFSVTVNKEAKVTDCGYWLNRSWIWRWSWR